jgi:HlyD family secretion protein
MTRKIPKKLGIPVRAIARRYAGLVVLAGFSFLGFIVVISSPNAEPLERSERSWPISVTIARPEALAPVLLAFGKVESRQVAILKTTISAPVNEVFVHEGAWVEEGDLLIQLDVAEADLAVKIAQASFNRSSAQLASVETEYELAKNLLPHFQELNSIADSKLGRATDLNTKDMISDSALDEARQEASERGIALQQQLAAVADFPNKLLQQQATVEESKAQLDKAKLDLDQTGIRAPFSGRVITNEVARGDRVIAGTSLIQIAGSAGLEVRASLPTEIGYALNQSILRGSRVLASAEVDGRPFKFELDRLSADVKPGQSGIDVFFRNERNEALDIGRVVSLTIRLPQEEDVIPMPVHALYENQTLFKVEENRLEAISYEPAGDYLDADGKFGILVRSAQMNAGDTIMVSQLPRAITGLLVDPIELGGAGAAMASDSGP